MKISNLIRSELCVGCGLCTLETDDPKTASEQNPDKLHYPQGALTELEVPNYCPGINQSINSSHYDYFGSNVSDLKLGKIDQVFLTSSTDAAVLKKASSGGVMTEICLFLLEHKIVDKIILQRLVYTPNGPRTESLVAKTKDQILLGQGSKYCPSSLHNVIEELISDTDNSTYAIVGTPCQILGLRKLVEEKRIPSTKIYLMIANFCGGFKDYRETNSLMIRNGHDPRNVKHFQYRGGGQPGYLKIQSKTGTTSIEYPKYGAGSLINKHRRCTLCVDGVGLLADISCGDAWLGKEHQEKWPQSSICVTRNQRATAIIDEMTSRGVLRSEYTSPENILVSQHHNLTSKIDRQANRRFIDRLLGKRIPEIDFQLPKPDRGVFYEVKVKIGKLKLNAKRTIKSMSVSK